MMESSVSSTSNSTSSFSSSEFLSGFTPEELARRTPQQLLNDLEKESNLLKDIKNKVEEQLSLLQLEETVLKKQMEKMYTYETVSSVTQAPELALSSANEKSYEELLNS